MPSRRTYSLCNLICCLSLTAGSSLPCVGSSSCGAQAPEWAQQAWLPGLAAQPHMPSSQTWDRGRVPCVGRRILNHWTTGDVQGHTLYRALLGGAGG